MPKIKIGRYTIINDQIPWQQGRCEFINIKEIDDEEIRNAIKAHPISGEMTWYKQFDNNEYDNVSVINLLLDLLLLLFLA